MENEELYPELIEYIFEYGVEFMTFKERVAARRVIFASEKPGERLVEAKKFMQEMLKDEISKQLLADGFEVFKNKLVERIYREHKAELNLNLCPKCGKIARTPQAKQCRFCYYDWHETGTKIN